VHILHGDEARERLIRGISKLAMTA